MKRLALALPLAACATAPVTMQSPANYACEGEYASLQVAYSTIGSARPMATLTAGNNTYTLYGTPAASGARYATSQASPALAGSYVWWTKADQGNLYAVTTTANGYTYEKQLASCITRTQ